MKILRLLNLAFPLAGCAILPLPPHPPYPDPSKQDIIEAEVFNDPVILGILRDKPLAFRHATEIAGIEPSLWARAMNFSSTPKSINFTIGRHWSRTVDGTIVGKDYVSGTSFSWEDIIIIREIVRKVAKRHALDMPIWMYRYGDDGELYTLPPESTTPRRFRRFDGY